MKKHTHDPIAWTALVLAGVALFTVIVVSRAINARLDAMPTVSTTGHGMEVRK